MARMKDFWLDQRDMELDDFIAMQNDSALSAIGELNEQLTYLKWQWEIYAESMTLDNLTKIQEDLERIKRILI